MRITALLGATAFAGIVGLAIVAIPKEPEPALALPNARAESAEPAATLPEALPDASRKRAVLPMQIETQSQQLSPDEPKEVASPAPSAGVDQDYHDNAAIEPKLIAPCGDGSRPSDLRDAECVAQWSVFHVAAGLVDLLDAQWIEPTLLDELSTSVPDPASELPHELLVLDSIGQPDQVGPGRAEVQVIVERAWTGGKLDHLFYRVTLVRGSQGTWSVLSIGRS